MEHLIRFKTAEGIDGTHTADSLDDAVAFAERVRNTEDATDVRLYRLTEVPIEFKPYYRIEVGPVEAEEHHRPPAAEYLHARPAPATDVLRHSDEVHAAGGPESADGRRLFSRVP